MKFNNVLTFVTVLFCAGCAETPFVMERPAYIPSSYHYVGGPDGGIWVRMRQKSRREYIITSYTKEGPSSWLFRIENEEPLPATLTEQDLSFWDGIYVHSSSLRLKMKRISRVNTDNP